MWSATSTVLALVLFATYLGIGALASAPGWLRYAAVAAGFAVFIVTRRSILAGVVCGELVMLAGKWWLG